LLKAIREGLATPLPTLKIIISTYEEVGHGASWVPELDELLAVDMGCIGDDLSCTEQMVSICCKDSSGPYDDQMTTKLVRLAEQNKLHFATDIYPFYGSDVSAALRGGNDLRGALIGPGVHASHGMERTHIEALSNTLRLLIAYISI
jgi:putative aminopeptidase FrvX